jgi:hypothetical protein
MHAGLYKRLIELAASSAADEFKGIQAVMLPAGFGRGENYLYSAKL